MLQAHVQNILKDEEAKYGLQPGALASWLPAILQVIQTILDAIAKNAKPTPSPKP